MAVVAATADERIATALANLSGAVAAFSELVVDAKDTTVETDMKSAGEISAATPYPSRDGDQKQHVVPLEILLSVQ